MKRPVILAACFVIAASINSSVKAEYDNTGGGVFIPQAVWDQLDGTNEVRYRLLFLTDDGHNRL